MGSFDEKILRHIAKESLITSGDRILIACSGGVDSVALLHFMAKNYEKLNVEIAAVHVDHMLRGLESAEDGILVKNLCEAYRVPFFGSRIPIQEIIAQDGGNMQAVCRKERYSFFSKTMIDGNFNVLATAHHSEDQLETVLMQLTKGNAPMGMPVKREFDTGILIRPFLPVNKQTLYLYAEQNQLEFREDPSNESDAYMRNRFRHHVIPHILKENSAAAESVVRLSDKLRDDEIFLESSARERLNAIVEFTDEGFPAIDSHRFATVPTALQRRMIPLLLNYLYDKKRVSVEYKTGLIEQLLTHLNSCDGNISINLPLGYQFLREYGKISFTQEKKMPQSIESQTLIEGEQIFWEDNRWLYWSVVEEVNKDLLSKADEVMYFDFPKELLPLHVRHRREGDRISLPGMSHSKRLSRLFIDEKVDRSERLCLPVVLTSKGEVCAVPGLRYGAAFTRDRPATGQYIFLSSFSRKLPPL